ncbi:MAG TPA: M28 family metallopeptidase, partial [Candidatus Brocadiia bacterium]|nr:M28 family metallopeptidase [Candidatus Brocadiia bacterium]
SKARNAASHGAALVLFAGNPAAWNAQLPVSRRLSMPEGGAPLDASIPVLHVSLSAAAELAGMSLSELRLLALDISSQREPQSTILRGRRVRFSAAIAGQPVLGRNILAALPGRDENLQTQAVVIGAHYDHLGEGGGRIFFGANDNASGVGCLLAVAQAFARLPQAPRRTIVFAAFDAEEIGRLGSRHYTAEPVLPIADTVLMVNFDMVGRNVPDEIMVVGSRSSPQLHLIHQQANRLVGLRLVHPASYRLGRSDHTWFYYARVPIIYFFGGIDPDYNTPRDTWDKLIPAKMERVARLAFLTAWNVAEREQKITFDESGAPLPDSPGEGAAQPAPRPAPPAGAPPRTMTQQP